MAYDSKTDTTRHAACSRRDCVDMEARNKWKLIDVETLPSAPSSSSVLKVNCVFQGDCQFDKTRMDLTQGDD
ncbi:hypothetical protein QGP82_14525 [Leptothoe sp. LEGE 181152]|nr:hypothetical protein [Leptothoe sp. LEGE 181152]